MIGRLAALLPPLLALAAILGAAVGIDRAELAAHRRAEVMQAAQAAADLRARLEEALNARLYLARGLAAFAKMHPALDAQQFLAFAEDLQGNRHGIRGLELAPRGVIRFIHPLAGNEAAMGLDLLGDATERQAAWRAILENRFLLVGPRRLVQGGLGLIARLPVFLPDAAVGTSWGRFWGFATIVIDFDQVLEVAGLTAPDGPWQVAVRGSDGRGVEGEVFLGDPALFRQTPVTATVSLPDGAWQIACRPRGGWAETWPGRGRLAGITAVLLLAASAVVLMLRLAAPAAVAEAGAGLAGARPLSQATILVVEDAPLNQAVLAELLQPLAGRLRVAANGQEALGILMREPVDLVLLDTEMPVLDGLQTAAIVRLNPAWAGLPVVAMTAGVAQEDVDRCLAAGMNDYLGKPVDPDALRRSLDRWLGRGPPPAAASGAAILPAELPGLDIAAGLQVTAGNAERFAGLVRRFAEDFGDIGRHLVDAAAAGRWPEVAAQAHGLRGAAANIGATTLAALAGQAEALARRPSPPADLAALLALLDRELLLVRQAAAHLATPAGTPVPGTPRPQAEVRDEIRRLVSMRRLVPGELVAELALHGDVGPLRGALDRFDYRSALAWLDDAVAPRRAGTAP